MRVSLITSVGYGIYAAKEMLIKLSQASMVHRKSKTEEEEEEDLPVKTRGYIYLIKPGCW